MNKVILIGRLTRDPEVRYSQGENATGVARFTLAVDRKVARNAGNQQQTADFISCIAFGKRCETIEKFVKQGTKIAVEGRIATGSYTNREEKKVYTTDVVVENFEFVESKGTQNNAHAAQNARQTGNVSGDGFMHIPDGIDEELPFA